VKRREMAVSEAELNSMTDVLDDMHQSSLPALRGHLAEINDHNTAVLSRPVGRRGALIGGLTLVGGGFLAACGSSSTGNSSATAGASSAPAGSAAASGSAASTSYTGDLKVVALAAGLENLAVAAYGMALTAAGKGTYGAVPPAFANFATVAMKQHSDHAAGWNSVLTAAKLAPVTTPAVSIASTEVAALTAAKTIPDVAKVALGLENGAASTYTFAVANISDAGGIKVAATIAPVEAMHAAILNFILGNYPVPASNIGTTDAITPDKFTG
jgi:hypothetical protein